MKICLTQVTGFTYTSVNQFSIFCSHLKNQSTYFMASNNKNGITNGMALLCKFEAGTVIQKTCNPSTLEGEVGGSGD